MYEVGYCLRLVYFEILLLCYETGQHFQLIQGSGHEWKMDAKFDSCDEIKQHYASDLLYPGQD